MSAPRPIPIVQAAQQHEGKLGKELSIEIEQEILDDATSDPFALLARPGARLYRVFTYVKW